MIATEDIHDWKHILEQFASVFGLYFLHVYQVDLMAYLNTSCPNQTKPCPVCKPNVEFLVNSGLRQDFVNIALRDPTVATLELVVYFPRAWSLGFFEGFLHDVFQGRFLHDCLSFKAQCTWFQRKLVFISPEPYPCGVLLRRSFPHWNVKFSLDHLHKDFVGFIVQCCYRKSTVDASWDDYEKGASEIKILHCLLQPQEKSRTAIHCYLEQINVYETTRKSWRQKMSGRAERVRSIGKSGFLFWNRIFISHCPTKSVLKKDFCSSKSEKRISCFIVKSGFPNRKHPSLVRSVLSFFFCSLNFKRQDAYFAIIDKVRGKSYVRLAIFVFPFVVLKAIFVQFKRLFRKLIYRSSQSFVLNLTCSTSPPRI